MQLKKSALAIIALFAAAAAQSEVVLYGTLDASFGSYQRLSIDANTEEVSTTRRAAVESGDMTASYIGFRGTEDLGGGLKASFNLESYLKVDTGANPASNGASKFWGRNTFIGLSSDTAGSLTLGHVDTLYFRQATAYNPFGASGAYSPTVRLAMAGALSDLLGSFSDAYNLGVDLSNASFYGAGWSNSITYTSPNLSGLEIGLQLGLKEDGAETQGRFAVSGEYKTGPVGLSLVIANDKFMEGGKLSSVLGGASYDFGVLKAYGQVGTHTIKMDGAEDTKVKFFQLGAGIPVSAEGSVMVSLGQSKWGDALKIRDLSIGYDHMISKRTDAYVALRDERFSGSDAQETLKQNAVSAGVRHRF
jgi:predicted porin